MLPGWVTVLGLVSFCLLNVHDRNCLFARVLVREDALVGGGVFSVSRFLFCGSCVASLSDDEGEISKSDDVMLNCLPIGL